MCALASGDGRDPRRQRVQVDIGTGCQQRSLIEDRNALEPPLEERAAGLILLVRQPGQRFLQALHEPTETAEPLARPLDPGGVQQMAFDPIVRRFQRPPHLVPRREQPSPAPDHLLVRPVLDRLGVEPHQQMEVIIEHREPGHRDPEDFRKFLQSMLDPFLTVQPLAQQLGAAHTAGDAVVPARNEWVDQMHACDRHGYGSPPGWTYVTTATRTASRPHCLS